MPAAPLPLTAPRSSAWQKFSASFLKRNPRCALCGSTKDVVAHHVKPFHLFPELELVETNLMPLCNGGSGKVVNCHLWFGHLGDFKRWNPAVREDAAAWRDKKLASILAYRSEGKPPPASEAS